MTRTALTASALRKVFQPRKGFFRKGEDKVAVDSVDLEIAEGELFVLLGKNGAGKTTLIKMLSTLVLPTGGSASIFGYDLESQDDDIRGVIGLATTDERSFFWRLTGRQNLDFYAALHGLTRSQARPRIEELMNSLEMDEFIDRRFDTYSSGMKQRMSLARSLLGQPRLLFLDEPTRSLDPQAQKQTWSLLRDLRKTGLTILLVTHHLDEAKELGDRFGFMENGNLTTFAPGEIDPATLF